MHPTIPTSNTTTFAVLSTGTWGITLAGVLAQNGYRVRAWDIDRDLIEVLCRERRHPKLEHYRIPDPVDLSHDLNEVLEEAAVGVLVPPSSAMRSLCQSIKAAARTDEFEAFVICSKGIETRTLKLMHEVLTDELGAAAASRTGILSGPSHAEEVARCMPTSMVASAPDLGLAEHIQQWFFRPYLRIYTHDDMTGVELGASVKNVIAIAAGICDGMGFGDNARAALMTRGLAEIVRLGVAAGARHETFMGLSGMGDLIVTAGSRHSRNRRFGELLATGSSVAEALKTIGMVVEGYDSTLSVTKLARQLGVAMPISGAVYEILYEGKDLQQAIRDLMARDPKPEHYT